MRVSSRNWIFHEEALRQLGTQLQNYKKSKGERIAVTCRFKDLTGVTRKYAIPPAGILWIG